MVRQEFGASVLSVQAETASAAVAAQAQASVQARYVMAMQRPRDMDTVRVRLLKECTRPGFAEVARYHKPVGAGIEGPSIRFAEAAIRLMGNILVEAPTIYDDQTKRIVRVVVTDLETNATYQLDIVVEKTVERSAIKPGQVVLSERANSFGKKVFLVVATDDEIQNKQNALISKAVRTEGLRLLPGDIKDEAMRMCIATVKDRDAKDPDAARKAMIDFFAEMNVTPEDLKEYVGHELTKLVPAELLELRALAAAIRDGEATWAAAMELKAAKKEAVTAPPAPTPPAAASAPAAAAPTPAPPVQAAAPAPAPAPSAPLPDPVELEVKDLEQVIAAAQSKKALQPFTARIKALPEPDRTRLMGLYTAKAKVLQ